MLGTLSKTQAHFMLEWTGSTKMKPLYLVLYGG